MTDSSGPSQKAEMPAPVNGPSLNPQDPPQPFPSFVHVLPCTNPPVKYLDLLDGCTTGIHVTRDDIQDLHVLYGRMAGAIMGKGHGIEHSPLEGATTTDPCAICLTPIVPSSTWPVLYLENCAHYFHYGCLLDWQIERSGHVVDCPHCRVPSCRALLWPQLFPTAADKNEHFQLQKRTFGIDVAPQTVFEVQKCSVVNGYPTFDLAVWTEIDWKHFTVCKGPSPEARDDQEAQEEPDASSQFSISELFPRLKMTELDFAEEIQTLHLADQPFYLGDILPLEENVQFQAVYGVQPLLDDFEKRQKLLLQFLCPFERLQMAEPDGEELCTESVWCEFWHDLGEDTPQFIRERVKLRQFPNFFCLNNSRTCGPKCEGRIQVHSQELVRCSAGFHPSTQDLKDMDGFAHKMAKLIMAPVVALEQHLVCAFCCKTAQPNSVWIHLQNCAHCLHMHCVPLVRPNNSNPNRKLHCPTCHVPSVRSIAWPGPFPSDMVKQTIFSNQLAQFKLAVQDDTQLEIVEVATGDLDSQKKIFTVDYGGPRLVIIDAATAQDNSTIWYD